MSTTNPNFESQLDRLVDGELSPAEYRSLLSSLDDEPDGWRRCAAAFLESQALGNDLSALRPSMPQARSVSEEQATTTSVAPVEVRLPHDRRDDLIQRTWHGLYLATIAASLALAFYVGSWTSPRNERAVDPSIAERRPERVETPARTELADGSATNSAATAGKDSPLGNVRLVMSGTENAQGVEVPVYSHDQVDRWRTLNKPVLPPHVIEQLQQAGHQVNHRQQYLLLTTEDGRQVYVPVDNYQIQPPRRQAY